MKIQKIFLGLIAAVFFAVNANAGRWLTRDPIEFMERDPKPQFNSSSYREEINLYAYVDNNPLNKIDPLGLSPTDVIRLTTLSQSYTSLLTQNGQRINGGGVNNFLSTLQSLSGNKKPYLGCGQQANALANFLNGTGADDQWQFYYMEFYEPMFHQIVVAQSSNPNDPLLYLDSWNNTFGSHPPVVYWMGPITPSINSGGSQNSTLPNGFHPGNGPYTTP